MNYRQWLFGSKKEEPEIEKDPLTKPVTCSKVTTKYCEGATANFTISGSKEEGKSSSIEVRLKNYYNSLHIPYICINSEAEAEDLAYKLLELVTRLGND